MRAGFVGFVYRMAQKMLTALFLMHIFMSETTQKSSSGLKG